MYNIIFWILLSYISTYTIYVYYICGADDTENPMTV